MPSTIGKCKLFRICYVIFTLLEGATFLRNKNEIAFFEMHIFFHMFFKSSVGFVLSNCLNAKKNKFGMRNTLYSIELSVHKQSSVVNTTYTIQSRVNCSIIFKFRELRIYVRYQPFCIVSLFLTDKKIKRVLVCSSIFYYSKKVALMNAFIRKIGL